ncbi:MAG: acetyl-CoA carboxylase carboxyltransferase subunit alpha [Candidatus Lambdaproteobacteria bacterium RIFOXYD12_FULL_49_8]|uniref:Acetyl-coenzyme A carboxylase carboxyl transferase subunit alpha n=1 Tax=Candidatus Lambdaproteobacteria bacterium RIFOXYD2_FULL_50_16 TaxID=1817772 RepID=A0A1F6GFU3_9PROT|nr:MAG: acetyl-CoA carboxylase carboxyltransferase subunit alpha [Candidatus Lambdaproteobacteria bacterium RIFOXYD12_FULL_49_8]OGG96978.1 MAG: acetyl-CoA carboxylase carboxyltransferase subunit alpha [Candidatus Lambdaproteobacteria bacterium RIFOXYD2_FULL_50_16]
MYVLEFEKPIIALRSKIAELQAMHEAGEVDVTDEIKKLEQKAAKLETNTYKHLGDWEKTLLARHPLRPYTLDFIEHCTTGFEELHGDRHFRDDPSIVGGICKIDKHPFMVIGHQKGRNTAENVLRNFGMPHPEGYRKALRLMKLAEKFGMPILTLIDTPGAYPGLGAEERGQSEAIAVNLREMAALKVPVIAVVTGEGGSGGALALGVANRVLMFEHSIYSVISPEGCASILYGDGSRAQEAAQNLKYVARELSKLGIIDGIIKEPIGGAHAKPEEALDNLKAEVLKNLKDLKKLNPEALVEDRWEKFRQIGVFAESR